MKNFTWADVVQRVHIPLQPFIARLVGTMLCAILITVGPLRNIGGPYAFLALPLKEHVFFPGSHISTQIEASGELADVLGITGCLLGVGWSCLGSFLAVVAGRRYGASAPLPRAILAMFFVSLAFAAGFIKSRLPRLHLTARIVCLTAIWNLTNNVGATSVSYREFTEFAWATFLAAATSLIPSLLFVRKCNSFPQQVVDAFQVSRSILRMHIHQYFTDARVEDSGSMRSLQAQLLDRSVDLHGSYARSVFELRIGRLSPKYMKPFVGIVDRVRSELSWGSSLPRQMDGALADYNREFLGGFEYPAQLLSNAIDSSMAAIQKAIVFAYDLPAHDRTTLRASPLDSFLDQRELLSHSVTIAKEELKHILGELTDSTLDELRQKFNEENDITISQKALFVISHSMISMLQIAAELEIAFSVAEKSLKEYEKSSPRLWYPRISIAWLGLPFDSIVTEEPVFDDEEIEKERQEDISWFETRQGLAELDQEPVLPIYGGGLFTGSSDSWDLRKKVKHFWSSSSTLRFRLWFSKIVRSVRNSSSFRFAIKNALGVALLTLPAYLPPTSSGARWFHTVHGQWAVISYLWVLETNIGATWRIGFWRLVATCAGVIYASVAYVICQKNPYAIVAALTLAEIPISWLVIHAQNPVAGVVFSITLPPILLTNYGTEVSSIAVLAVYRASTIAIGIVAAILINHFIYPRHSRVLFLLQTGKLLGQITDHYISLSRHMFQNGFLYPSRSRKEHARKELEMRRTLIRQKEILRAMDLEISLLPKPMRVYRNTIDTIQRILDILTGLRRIRENVPKRGTIRDLLPERQSLVSAICLTLYACEHAFRSRQSLPQFLPSARHALVQLVSEKEARLQVEHDDDPHALSLSEVFSLAENEAMEELTESMEALEALSRTLFGTSSWVSEALARDWEAPTPTEWRSMVFHSPHAHSPYAATNLSLGDTLRIHTRSRPVSIRRFNTNEG
ncbi:hypothetical protein BOTBODRAFT_161808 [Botryobasidium botryosum FD-172 SS1]|uniref:Uncharacterized protein n=1 Tax=Botryobasidium botryosum (strain FD-172 SS1) TaxID=930990 RepID=A0A067M9N4_BOTB1|nr:hypothetical protein BOTBODRAFT_161808 [Botryobasidium botryosum FD-172 SS1]